MLFDKPPRLSIPHHWLRWASPVKLLTGLLIFQSLGLFLWAIPWQPTNQTAQKEHVALSFLIAQDEQEPWEEVIHNFQEDHPNISITVVSDPKIEETDDRQIAYWSDLRNPETETQYDLVYMDSMWTAEFVNNLSDLNERLAREKDISLDDFLPDDVDQGRYGDGFYRVPMRSDIGVLFYRKDLLPRFQPGKSSEQSINLTTLQTIVETVKAENPEIQYGYLWQGKEYEGLIANFLEVLSSLGGTWIDEKKQVHLNQEEARKAAQVLQDLIRTGLSPKEVTNDIETDSFKSFQAGQALFWRGWPVFLTTLQDSEMNNKVGMTLPFSFSNKSGTGCRGGWGFGIPKKSTHQDEAWDAIKYFTSAAAQKRFTLESGYLPSRTALFTDPDIQEKFVWMPQILGYLQQSNSSVFRPSLENYSEVSEILQKALHTIISSTEVNISEVLAIAQRETEAALDTQQ